MGEIDWTSIKSLKDQVEAKEHAVGQWPSSFFGTP
jgi:hypothetical protein